MHSKGTQKWTLLGSKWSILAGLFLVLLFPILEIADKVAGKPLLTETMWSISLILLAKTR
jgi:hypothetical protein